MMVPDVPEEGIVGVRMKMEDNEEPILKSLVKFGGYFTEIYDFFLNVTEPCTDKQTL